MDGLQPSAGKEFRIFFRIVLPKDAWGLDAGNLSVSLRFGHPRLGSWMINVGNFNDLR